MAPACLFLFPVFLVRLTPASLAVKDDVIWSSQLTLDFVISASSFFLAWLSTLSHTLMLPFMSLWTTEKTDPKRSIPWIKNEFDGE